MSAADIVQIATAILTVVFIVVTVFKDTIYARFFHPTLEMSIGTEEPDCHWFKYGLPPDELNAFWCRLRVSNTGSVRAEKVEIQASRLTGREITGGRKSPVDIHLFQGLRWANSYIFKLPGKREMEANNGEALRGLSPKMFGFCDLGCIVDPRFNLREKGTSAEDLVFELALNQYISSNAHQLKHGTYELDLTLAAANVKPTHYKVTIAVPVKFPTQAHEMETFAAEIKITLAKTSG
jgi:hypothetical protein